MSGYSRTFICGFCYSKKQQPVKISVTQKKPCRDCKSYSDHRQTLIFHALKLEKPEKKEKKKPAVALPAAPDPSPNPVKTPPAKKQKSGSTVEPPTTSSTATPPARTPTTEAKDPPMDLDPPALAETHQQDCNCTQCLTQLLAEANATLLPSADPAPVPTEAITTHTQAAEPAQESQESQEIPATSTTTIELPPEPRPTPMNPGHLTGTA
ncbi:uncharacterized protein [Palaemon carinicauda]|uniref:uncharacterized protein n=1 Tax=Palaemon carinicauda TaxID=392227 RepID=UPI0035B5EAF2